jgi:hypothetical protein
VRLLGFDIYRLAFYGTTISGFREVQGKQNGNVLDHLSLLTSGFISEFERISISTDELTSFKAEFCDIPCRWSLAASRLIKNLMSFVKISNDSLLNFKSE